MNVKSIGVESRNLDASFDSNFSVYYESSGSDIDPIACSKLALLQRILDRERLASQTIINKFPSTSTIGTILKEKATLSKTFSQILIDVFSPTS